MKNLIKSALLGILIGSQAVAGLPPTSSKDSGDTSPTTTFTFEFPHFTGTHTGTIFSLGVNGVAGGGTGISTVPSNGYLLIGNGSDYTSAALTPGSGISVTNGSGSVTIAETFPMPSPSPSGNYLTANGTNWVSSTGPTIYTDNGANTYLSTNLIVSNNLATQINNSSQQARLEIGNNNLLIDPSFETSTLGAWSKGSGVSVITETSYFVDGGQAAELSLSSVTAGETLWYQDVTPGQPLNAVNGLASLWIYSTQANNLEVCPRSGGTTITTVCTPLTTASVWSNLPANFIFPSTGSVGVALVAVNNIASGTAYVDSGYLGLATNLSQTSQAQTIGSLQYAPTSGCIWTNTNTSVSAQSAQTSCPAATVTGQAAAPSTKIPGITFSSLPPGIYEVVASSQFSMASASVAAAGTWTISDGTNTHGTLSALANASGSYSSDQYSNTLVGFFNYTTAQSSITFQVESYTSSGSNGAIIDARNTTQNGFEISVIYYPTQSQLTYAANLPTQPQVTVYTSGSGTYTVPAGATRLEVKMAGGGGGGGGSASTPIAGSNGTDSTFGSSFLTASHGVAPSTNTTGGAGGSYTIGSGAYDAGNSTAGGAGQSSFSDISTLDAAGGAGGANPLGGSGQGGPGSTGGAGATNSGAGGGGGGLASSSGYAGAGGGAGGYIDAIITSNSSAWASSYSYAVGPGGAGGSSGATEDGGAGAAGKITVTAYFGNQPLQFVGQVSSSGTGQTHMEAGQVVCSSSASISSQASGSSWLSTIGNISSGACAVTLASGEFSATPYCWSDLNVTSGTNQEITHFSASSTTAASVSCTDNSTIGTACTTFTANVFCLGNR